MAAFSDYLEAKVLNWSLRATAMGTAPSSVYISLHTTATTDAGGGTEVSGNDYARAEVNTTGGFTAPDSGGVVENDADITFPTASGGNWGTVTHIGIWDASTSGNLLYHGALAASKTVNDGDTFRLSAGQLTITVA